jgi:hypothetical protein
MFVLNTLLHCSQNNSTSPNANRKNCSFRIIKISHIKEIISTSGECRKDYLPISQVQVDRLKSREAEALRGFKSEVSKIGVGVTKEGQDIFNALSKT